MAEDAEGDEAPEMKDDAVDLLQRSEYKKKPKRLQSLSGHSNGFILAMEYKDGVVVTIGSDRILNVWNGRSGQRMAFISQIPGTFVPGYPYIVQRTKNRVVYTSDDGIFMAVF